MNYFTKVEKTDSKEFKPTAPKSLGNIGSNLAKEKEIEFPEPYVLTNQEIVSTIQDSFKLQEPYSQAGGLPVTSAVTGVDMQTFTPIYGSLFGVSDAGMVTSYNEDDKRVYFTVRGAISLELLRNIVKIHNLQTFENNTEAAALEVNTLYKTSNGDIKIKF